MGAGAGSPLLRAAMCSTGLHTVLRKRNLPTVRLEKTFLPEPSAAPGHNTLYPCWPRGRVLWCQLTSS